MSQSQIKNSVNSQKNILNNNETKVDPKNFRKINKKNIKKVKIILPSLSDINNPQTNKDNNHEKVETKSCDDKKDSTQNKDNKINSILKHPNENKKTNINSNRNTFFPSLKKGNLSINKESKNNSQKSILNASNKTVYIKSDLKDIKTMRNKLLLKNKNTWKNRTLIMNKSNEISTIDKNFKNLDNSKIKISKIKLNEIFPKKPEIIKLNLNNGNSKDLHNRSIFRHNSTIIDVPNHSYFFKISQKDDISAKKIYKHYLNKSAGDIVPPIRNYKRFFDNRSKSFLEKLSRIYCEDKNFLSSIKELKHNKKIAFKDDFNIEEYQSTLIELLDQRVSQKNLLDLQNNYKALNRKLYGLIEPKGRYTILAEKLRFNLPLYLLERFKQLDKDSILSRMRFYNKFKRFKNGKKLVSRFERKYNDNVNKNNNDDSMNFDLLDDNNFMNNI